VEGFPLNADLSDLNRSNETIFRSRRSRRETRIDHYRPSIKQRGAIMWAFIISLVYDRSCKKYLADMGRHQHRWI